MDQPLDVPKKRGKKGKKATATAKLIVTTDGTKAPIGSQPVAFQKKAGKSWKTFKTVTTNASGVAKATFKRKKGMSVRVHFAGAGEVIVGGTGPAIPAATSKAVRVR